MEKEKYEIVLEAIEAGGATPKSLMALLNSKSIRGVNLQFKFINVLKKYPVLDGKSGVYSVLGPEEYDKLAKTSDSPKTAEKKWTSKPQNKRVTLESRLNTKVSRMNAAKRKFEDDLENTTLKLKNTIAVCEFHLANIAMSDFQSKMCTELNVDLETYKNVVNLDDLQENLKAEALIETS